ncbi:MAG TPA: Flp pilus assembly protein CpaB [Gemmataceae bacterium]|jgi:pilus assembly protein CpaB
MKSSKTMILMVVAVGCGLVASFLTSRLLAERGNSGPVMVKRLVAKKNLALGTVIKDPEKYFVEKEFPEDSAPKKGYENFDQIKNQKLTKPVSEDAPITKDDIMEGAGASFAQAIPPGCEALAIKVNPEGIAGGFVQPMDRVDVVWTLNRGDASKSQTLLQNMLVLATDTDAARNTESQAKLATTVTIAVKPEEGQKLTLAAQNGELRLMLRKYGHEDILQTRPTTLVDLIKSGNHVEGNKDDDPPEPAKNPNVGAKPVDVPVVTVASDQPKEDEGKIFSQSVTNGPTTRIVAHHIGGKNDGAADVIKSDPLVGPKTPVKQPEPPKPSDSKPKTDAAPDKDDK